MKILILGANGQLAKTLKQSKPRDINLISLSRNEFNFLDLQKDLKRIENINPTHIINAAAYTDVDKAESEEDIAKQINAYAPFEIASKFDSSNCKFIHITTDCVYNGFKGNYSPNDNHTTNTIYGITKSLGEGGKAVRNVIKSANALTIGKISGPVAMLEEAIPGIITGDHVGPLSNVAKSGGKTNGFFLSIKNSSP